MSKSAFDEMCENPVFIAFVAVVFVGVVVAGLCYSFVDGKPYAVTQLSDGRVVAVSTPQITRPVTALGMWLQLPNYQAWRAFYGNARGPAVPDSDIVLRHKIAEIVVRVSNRVPFGPTMVLYFGFVVMFIFAIFAQERTGLSPKIEAAYLAAAGGTATIAGPLAIASIPTVEGWDEPILIIAACLYCLISAIYVWQLIRLSSELNLFRGGSKKGIVYAPKIVPPQIKHGTQALTLGSCRMDILPTERLRQYAGTSQADIRIAVDTITRHVALVGKSGSGKTRLQMQIIDMLIRDGFPGPIIVHDVKGGELMRRYYNPGRDLIFAPHDTRSFRWALFDDIKNNPIIGTVAVVAALAARMESDGVNSYWFESAKRIIQSAIVLGDSSLDGLAAEIAKMRRNQELGGETEKSKYQTLIEGINDLVRIDHYDPAVSGKTLTTTELMQHKGFIFMLNPSSAAPDQNGAINVFVSVLMSRFLDQPAGEGGEIRAVMFLDEISSFRFPKGLEDDVYNRGRAHGIVMIGGSPAIPDKHKRTEPQRWVEGAATKIVFSLADLPSLQYFSQLAGVIIYKEEQQSRGYKGPLDRAHKTDSEVERKHNIFETSFFLNIPTRHYILFHDDGICPGVTPDVQTIQQPGAGDGTFSYTVRKDIYEYMKRIEGDSHDDTGNE